MRDLVRLIVWAVVDLFRSRAAIEAEVLTLRQQIIVLRRTAPKKQSFDAIDRLVFVGPYRRFPRVLDALAIVRPATVIKWHRAGLPWSRTCWETEADVGKSAARGWRWPSGAEQGLVVVSCPASMDGKTALMPSRWQRHDRLQLPLVAEVG